MNVLVTGGAGYIGSHACQALRNSGFNPVVYDNLSRGNRWAVKWGPLEEGDILDRRKLDYVFKKYKPTAVFHFAALAYVGESIKNPDLYYENNVLGSYELLQAMKQNGVKKFIFSSTCATYGIPQTLPITESHLQNPINPYGHTKLLVEQMLRFFDTAYELKSIVLRYFNAAGADPAGEIGEHHSPETHVIPLLLDSAFDPKVPFVINGVNHDTEDGTCVRDYIHVTDLAHAHVLALRKLLREPISESYNLGNGLGFSVKQLIQEAESISGRSINAVVGDRRAGDPAILVGSAAKAIEELQWKPRYADIATILQTAYRWHHAKKFGISEGK